MIENILVVCVGNICRSPMAEALLRADLGPHLGVSVESAGLGALVGHPAAPDSVALMQERGLDIRAHRARQIHPDMVARADLVLVMETAHEQSIMEADPAVQHKIERLGKWQNRDIRDPYRRPREAYEVALEDIEVGVVSWAAWIRRQLRR